ncbi:uncharacterized protein LOC132703372 isoform X2 [Cylas formicarius]|uniref:uncharacterized protein LOC132703372 isoform X2 n=1 Tax=Cylas formicarius TaxID=197179 RepID=UPI00295863A8|nr:uncharacterized protein LOC132703372 isoform X2 [Cylas formicarius]
MQCTSVSVNFAVPLLHEIVTRCAKLIPKDRRTISECNLTVKTGKFSKCEDNQIKRNWTDFIKEHNLRDEPSHFFNLDSKVLSKGNRIKFLQHLAQNLPDRTLYSVYQRFKRLFNKQHSGRFTPDEDKYILSALIKYRHVKHHIQKIAQDLKRTRTSVEQRVLYLKHEYKPRGVWRNDHIEKFIKNLLMVTQCQYTEELKQRTLTSIEWKTLSEKLDNTPMKILQTLWQGKIYPMLFIKDDFCNLNQIKVEIVTKMYTNREADWKTVDWNYYASQFPGFTPLKIYMLLKKLVVKLVPKENQTELEDCLKILHEAFKRGVKLKKHKINKIVYKDGKLLEM